MWFYSISDYCDLRLMDAVAASPEKCSHFRGFENPMEPIAAAALQNSGGQVSVTLKVVGVHDFMNKILGVRYWLL